MSERRFFRPSAIFFDMDGTLIDSYGFLMIAHNHVREVFDLPLFSEDEFLFNLSRTTTEVYNDLYGARASEAKRILYEYVNENRSARITPMKGANEFLAFVQTCGIAMGVVSNMNPRLLHDQIQSLGWTHYFGDAIVGAGDAPEPKPSGLPLILAAQRANIGLDDPARIWMIGDTETDIGCARAAHCTSVLLRSRRDWENIVRNMAPDLSAHHFSEIKNFITELEMPTQRSDEILAPR